MELLNITITSSHVAVLTMVLFFAYLYIKLKPKKKKHPIVKNWKNDMVYLCQFPCSPKMRSISPFAIKLETWFRLTGIKYTNVYTSTFSKSTKMIPYIEFNGKEFADTSLIIDKFKEIFRVNPDDMLKPGQRALAHCIKRMVECHTIKYAFYWRYGLMMPIFYENVISSWEQNTGLIFFKKLQPILSRVRAHFNGISRLSRAEQLEQCRQDFEVLSIFLGEKEYFLGTKQPTTIDCAVFGILVQFFWMPNVDICPALQNTVNKSFKNLNQFTQRIKVELWPDWDKMCSALDCRKGIGQTFGTLTPA